MTTAPTKTQRPMNRSRVMIRIVAELEKDGIR